MDVELVTGDATDLRQPRLTQPLTQLSRTEAGSATVGVVGIVDADQAAQEWFPGGTPPLG
jgi:hypothetical protein